MTKRRTAQGRQWLPEPGVGLGLLAIALLMLVVSGCDEDDEFIDVTPPAIPAGVSILIWKFPAEGLTSCGCSF